ncbi:MAG: carboxylesterase family protein [Planctomycetes bacterium]|nr:carboxylesterase family protein [Planctomycetota bacterium]
MPRFPSFSRAAAAVVAIISLGWAADPNAPVVRIDSGPIAGAYAGEGKAIRVFRGVPYAAPPVGDLRWKAPRPPKPWVEVRDTAAFGSACPQPRGLGLAIGADRAPQDEDCLSLNVWTPAKSEGEKLAVMVWIHGGGFSIGSSAQTVYDGASLARRGVVVVTINYRLGPFGFFAHPLLSKESPRGVSGNYGLLDQIEALRWVRRNIARFGGDPGRVTIFGESAGAVSVGCLMVSPLAAGLFHRAIAQSGGVRGIDRRLRAGPEGGGSAEDAGETLAKTLGCAEAKAPLAALRAKSAEEILAAANPAPISADPERSYGPIVDGWVLPDTPAGLWAAGRQHDVPLIAGSNADDGGVFAGLFPVKRVAGYRLAVRARLGEETDEALALFPAERDEDVPAAVRRILTVAAFVAPARSQVRAMEPKTSKAWLYHFARVPAMARTVGIGAAHGIEIPYVFGTAHPWMGIDEDDRALSDAIGRYWVAFAREGDPAVKGLPVWPAYAAATDRHLLLGDRIAAGERLFREACDLFDRIAAKGRRGPLRRRRRATGRPSRPVRTRSHPASGPRRRPAWEASEGRIPGRTGS